MAESWSLSAPWEGEAVGRESVGWERGEPPRPRCEPRHIHSYLLGIEMRSRPSHVTVRPHPITAAPLLRCGVPAVLLRGQHRAGI